MLLNNPIPASVGFALLAIGIWWALARYSPPKLRWLRRAVTPVVAVVFAASLITLAWGLSLASGDSSDTTEQLADGVEYQRLGVAGAVGHLLTIDLNNPCLALVTTQVSDIGETKALKTETWAEQQDVVVAMNASFFFPFHEYQWLSSYPEEGEDVWVLGKTVVEGEVFARPEDWAGSWKGESVWINDSNQPGVGPVYPDDAWWGVTGRERILTDGETVARSGTRYSRAIIGVNAESMTMWWLIIDGKQPGYSRGATLRDAATFLVAQGATDAVEMDGGGSAILVSQVEGQARQLSRPIHQKIPGRSRVVANHVGIRTLSDC